MTVDRDQARISIQDALDALKRGDRSTAQRLAERAASQAPDWETPWLILTALSNPEESLAFIDQALKINPASRTAQQALVWALERQHSRPQEPEYEIRKESLPSADKPRPEAVKKQSVRSTRPQPGSNHERDARFAKADTEPTRERIAQVIGFEPEPPDGLIPIPAGLILPIDPYAKKQEEPIPSADGEKPVKPPSSLTRSYLYAPLALSVLALITGFVLYKPQLSALWSRLMHPAAAAQCSQPMLKIGDSQWPINSTARSTDGSLPIPGQSDNAFWVEGTTINNIFELNPTEAGVSALSGIKAGDSITITWADCTTAEYVVSTIDSRSPITPAIFDQMQGGVVIFIPGTSSMAKLMIRGIQPETLIPVSGAPTAEPEIQAGITLINQAVSSDGKTLTLIISITNTGTKALNLVEGNISLTVGNSAALSPLSLVPAVPQEIAPGASLTFIITFTRPEGNSAVFRALDFNTEIHY